LLVLASSLVACADPSPVVAIDGSFDAAVASDGSTIGDAAPSTDPSRDGDSRPTDGGVDAVSPNDGGADALDASDPSDASVDASEGGPAPSPSCVAGSTGAGNDCGPVSDQYCCGSPPAIGGTFHRSFDGVTLNDTGYPATVSPFRLDTYEVTVGRYRAFVNAGMGTQASAPPAGAGAHPLIAGSGWDPAWNIELPADTTALRSAIACNATYQVWTDTPGANERRAMNCINWYDAFAFCAWDGKRLATEAEWGYAAAGGDEQRVYPWSAPPSSTTVSVANASYNGGDPDTCMGDGVPGCSSSDLLAVGSKPAGNGKWGHADLGGNAWEWVLDAYADPYAPGACVDCANLGASTQRVVRGGGYFSGTPYMRAGYREGYMPSARDGGFGVRCAR
jgi:formylglycine-generating enzyme required for sulfatase activity